MPRLPANLEEWWTPDLARAARQVTVDDPTVCRNCRSSTGGNTGLAICEETRICYLVDDSGERAHGCHHHFTCRRCTSRQRHGSLRTPPPVVTHCSNYYGMCEECWNCDQMCECSRCANCEERTDDYCGNCGRCGSCGCTCDNGRSQRPPHIRRTTDKFHTAVRKQRIENPSPRYIAVEIEVCGIKKPGTGIEAVVRKWGGAIVSDGSLPDGGFEINTAPASGDLYLKQIREIAAELEKAGAWVDEHAGMHCHVDARDLRYYDMRRVVKLYAHMEDALYRLCGVHRRTSHYCVPCGQTLVKSLRSALSPKASKKALLRNVYGAPINGKRFKEVKLQKHNDCRYAALNLHSWVFRGSLECRMYHGTTRANSAICWGMLWAGIVDFAAKTGEREIDALMAEKSGRDCLLVCAPTDAVREWMRARWNFLSRAHEDHDEVVKELATRRRQDHERQSLAYRSHQDRQMRNIAIHLGLAAGPPSWAVDFRITDEGQYQWLGADELHLDVFGEE